MEKKTTAKKKTASKFDKALPKTDRTKKDMVISYVVLRSSTGGVPFETEKRQGTLKISHGLIKKRDTADWQKWNGPINAVLEKEGLVFKDKSYNEGLIDNHPGRQIEVIITDIVPDPYLMVAMGERDKPIDYARTTRNNEMQRIFREANNK